MHNSDKILFLQLKSSDALAFEKIYNEYYNILHAYIFEILENRLFVKDIIEDVFLKLWEKREELTIKTSIKAYLLASARNACVDFIRKRNVREDYKARIEEKYKIEEGFDLFKVVETDSFREKELKQLIKKAVDALPRKCRRVFKLSRYFKMKNKEIAHRLKISENTVEKHMGTAFSKIKEALSKYYHILIIFTGF